MASLNVPMSDELRAYLDKRAKEGGFSTPSEYVRHLIREDRAREGDRRLEGLILEGLDSGPAREWGASDWAEIRNTVRKRVAERAADRLQTKRAGSQAAAKGKRGRDSLRGVSRRARKR